MNLQDVRMDVDAVNNGRWVDIEGGGKIKVARWNNRAFLTLYSAMATEAKENKKEPDHEEITNKCLAECILLGWDGISDGVDEVVYSVEKSIEIITDPGLEDFKNMVIVEAQKAEHFRLRELDEAAKKPQNS